MPGFDVSRSLIDMRAGEACRDLRDALAKTQRMAAWLADQPRTDPDDPTTDPLVAVHGYTADDAYLLRVTFERLDQMRVDAADTLALTRKITGLD